MLHPLKRLSLALAMSLFSVPLWAAPDNPPCEQLSIAAHLNATYFDAIWRLHDGVMPTDLPRGAIDAPLAAEILPSEKRGLVRDPFLLGRAGTKLYAGDFVRRMPEDGLRQQTIGVLQSVFIDGDGNPRALIIERNITADAPVVNRLLAPSEHRELFAAREAGPSVEALFNQDASFRWPSLINNSPLGYLKIIPELVVNSHPYRVGQLVSYQVHPAQPRKLARVSFLSGGQDIEHALFVTDEVAPNGQSMRMILSPRQIRSLSPIATLDASASKHLALRYLGNERLMGANGKPLKVGDWIYFNANGAGRNDLMSWDHAQIAQIHVAPRFITDDSRIGLNLLPTSPLGDQAALAMGDDHNLLRQDSWLQSAAALRPEEIQARFDQELEDSLLVDPNNITEGSIDFMPNDHVRHVTEIMPNNDTYAGKIFRQRYHRRPGHLMSHLNLEHWVRKYPRYTRLYGMQVDRDSLLIPDATAFSAYFHRVNPSWGFSFYQEDYHPRMSEAEKGLDFGRRLAKGELPYNALLPVQALMIPLIGKERLEIAQRSARFLLGVWESVPPLRQIATTWLWQIREWYLKVQYTLSLNFDVELPQHCLRNLEMNDIFGFELRSPKLIHNQQRSQNNTLPELNTTTTILRPLNAPGPLVNISKPDQVESLRLSPQEIYRTIRLHSTLSPDLASVLDTLAVQGGVEEMENISLGEVMRDFEMLAHPPAQTFP